MATATFPLTDNHIHIDELNGYGLDAVKKFKRAGGNTIFLVNKLTKDMGSSGVTLENFHRLYEKTLALGERIEELGIKVFTVLGVHPAEFHFMLEEIGRVEALQIAKDAVDLACGFIEDNKAVALGELGRPHYEVSKDVIDACHELLFYAFKKAGEIDCAVQLHTESIGESGFYEFSELAEKAGLSSNRVVKHFSPPFIEVASKTGIMPSLISKRVNILEALKEGKRFLMESDYIDDRRRPGAVVGPKSVPRVTLNLLREGFISEEDVYIIHKENIEEVYGIDIEF